MSAMLLGKKKIFSILICLLLALTFVLSSCTGDQGGDELPTESTTHAGNGELPPEEPEERPATIEEWLPLNSFADEDGNAVEYKLLTHYEYNTNYMFFQYETSDDPLRAAAYSRTMQIAEMYDLAFDHFDTYDVTGTLQASIMGGGGEYDLIYPHPDNVFPILENNLITDLTTYDNIYLDQPWWNHSADVFNFNGRVYFAASDFSICGQGLAAMIFNRDLWNDLQLDYDLYGMVWDKTWTMEKLREIVMLYGYSADDKYDLNDSYGMLYQRNICGPFYWSMGGRIMDYDEYNAQYKLMLDIDQATKIAKALDSLLWDTQNKVYQLTSVTWAGFSTSEGWAAYKNGNCLFMTYDVGVQFRHLLPVTFDIGYMPLPKLTVEQQGYPAICGSGFFMLPRKAKDPIMSSVILEACCIVSYTDFRAAFFNTILLGRLSKVEEDYKMLEYLHESKVYDLGSSIGGIDVGLGLVQDGKTGLVSSFLTGRAKDRLQRLAYAESLRQGAFSD